jgi:hypothetical protein
MYSLAEIYRLGGGLPLRRNHDLLYFSEKDRFLLFRQGYLHCCRTLSLALRKESCGHLSLLYRRRHSRSFPLRHSKERKQPTFRLFSHYLTFDFRCLSIAGAG